MKTTMPSMKNKLDMINIKLEMAEEKNSELEDVVIEITQN